ncbi:segregation/condensation protein A [Candidatus Micrarchaeota archaeon]|nr:segregation/condensation protein A [Candidatus Micrarchaeota archaeon]
MQEDATVLESTVTLNAASLDLETLVQQATWREILVDVVHSGQMNPWEIDIGEIADRYLQKVRELSSLDLRLPANVILASALLLRFKADGLNIEEDGYAEQLALAEFSPRELIQEEIPQLIARTNKPRARKITLEELIQAVEEVIASTNSAQLVLPAPKMLELELPKETLHELIEKIYALANELKDDKGIAKFSSLLDPNLLSRDSRGHVVSRLIPVLHLVQERKIDVWQEHRHGEIHLKVL